MELAQANSQRLTTYVDATKRWTWPRGFTPSERRVHVIFALLLNLAVYVLAFPYLFEIFNTATYLVPIFIPVVMGGCFGWKVGAFAGLCVSPANVMIASLWGYEYQGGWIRAFPGLLLQPFVGIVVGRLHEISRELKRQFAEKDQANRRARALEAELASLNRLCTVGEMAGTLAHDMSRPLAIISGRASVALSSLTGDDKDLGVVASALGEITEETNRAARLIQNLSFYIGERRAATAPLELNDLCREFAQLAHPDGEQIGATVRLELHSEPILLSGDRLQLGHAVLSVIRNAIESLAKVPANRRNVTIHTDVSSRGEAVIQVIDQGIGIPDYDQERVMEPFYTTKIDRLGLGLAIARNIVVGHGGRIAVRSRHGEGSTFFLFLPLKA